VIQVVADLLTRSAALVPDRPAVIADGVSARPTACGKVDDDALPI
jgi:hypothetical protein